MVITQYGMLVIDHTGNISVTGFHVGPEPGAPEDKRTDEEIFRDSVHTIFEWAKGQIEKALSATNTVPVIVCPVNDPPLKGELS